MISGIGGGMGGMPSMDAMRQMQQKMFSKADADASGGLDIKEFESAMANSPMAGKGPKGVTAQDAFKKIDGDGNGQLSTTEMQAMQDQMMQRMQSTMQAFGGAGAGGMGGMAGVMGGGAASDTQSSLDALLKALQTNEDADTSTETADSTSGTAKQKDLSAQLRAMVDRLTASYGQWDTQSVSHGGLGRLLSSA